MSDPDRTTQTDDRPLDTPADAGTGTGPAPAAGPEAEADAPAPRGARGRHHPRAPKLRAPGQFGIQVAVVISFLILVGALVVNKVRHKSASGLALAKSGTSGRSPSKAPRGPISGRNQRPAPTGAKPPEPERVGPPTSAPPPLQIARAEPANTPAPPDPAPVEPAAGPPPTIPTTPALPIEDAPSPSLPPPIDAATQPTDASTVPPVASSPDVAGPPETAASPPAPTPYPPSTEPRAEITGAPATQAETSIPNPKPEDPAPTPSPIAEPTPAPKADPVAAPEARAAQTILASEPPRTLPDLETKPVSSVVAEAPRPTGPARSPADVARDAAGWIPLPSTGRKRKPAADPDEPDAVGLASPTPRPGSGRAAGSGSITHLVREDEDFGTIARDYYGSTRFRKALWAVNRRKVPKLDGLAPGVTIVVPMPEALDPALVAPAESETADDPTTGPTASRRRARSEARTRRAPRPGEVDLMLPVAHPAAELVPLDGEPARRPSYVVHPGETLRSIARDTLGDPHREAEILDLNRRKIRDPHRLPEGLRLALPDDAETGRRLR